MEKGGCLIFVCLSGFQLKAAWLAIIGPGNWSQWKMCNLYFNLLVSMFPLGWNVSECEASLFCCSVSLLIGWMLYLLRSCNSILHFIYIVPIYFFFLCFHLMFAFTVAGPCNNKFYLKLACNKINYMQSVDSGTKVTFLIYF